MKYSIRLKLEDGDKVVAVRPGANNGHAYEAGVIGTIRRYKRESPTITTNKFQDLGYVDLSKWERLIACTTCEIKHAEESGLTTCATCHTTRCLMCHKEHQPCKKMSRRKSRYVAEKAA